ncbi:MAG: hypothetical protein CL764_02360 [Chloroflexi bacterium]|nr:hypothetical protein [Chloroflexota bacterium]|tara:strand:- start:1711 stop:2346 length:636 start_codon:yes stop_codon:yes gene_type:complete
MRISWKSGNTIVADTNSGKIIFDPKKDNLSPDDQKDSNTVLTFSSESLYESTKGKIIKESKNIFGPGEYEFGKIGLKSLAHGNPETKDESTINNIIIAECENLSICHLGNLSLMLSTSLIAQNISGVDILLIPLNTSSLNMDEITSLIRSIDPRVVIPMNYKFSEQTSPEQKLFSSELGVEVEESITRASLTKSNLNSSDGLKVIYLKPGV